MDERLLPCPFCGAGEIVIKDNTYWTGMSSQVISVEVYHWCEETTGVRGSHITMRAKTRAEAIEKWNKRAHSAGANDGD